MHLKRLTISGFKSFANKTVLELEPGVSAIVGPNGAGKSNVADAVRWVLGEQSSRMMRAKKGEEVIFAGTEKRPKASMAEVSLLLDNSDGALELDFSEIELVRRLYRSGESEYRLNDRKVSLRDIQHLLIQAGFGPNSYAVIGQGMIDQLILASPAERKLLFDEASGIRGYEMKREQASRKLEATDANLIRVRDILSELEPQLAILLRSAEAAKARQQVAQELVQSRANYIEVAENFYRCQQSDAEHALSELHRSIAEAELKVDELEQRRQKLINQPEPQADLSELHALEAKRDHLTNQLSVKRAELQFLVDKQADQSAEDDLAGLEKTLAKVKQRRQGLTKAVAEAQVTETETSERLAKISKTIDRLQARLAGLRRQSDQTSRQEYITQALAILKQASHDLSNLVPHEQVRLLVYKAGRLLSHASRGQVDLLSEIRAAQSDLMAAMKQRDDAHEPYANAVINLRSLELDLNHVEEEVLRLNDQLKVARHLHRQRQAIAAQIAERQSQLKELDQTLEQVNVQVQELRRQAGEPTGQLQTNQIFQLAGELETAKVELSNRHQQQAQAQDRLSQSKDSLATVAIRRREWFGAANLPAVAADSADPQELERQVELLEARLADNRTNDAEVLEEYQDATERYQFLSEQVTDLETAQLDLQTVISTLDRQIKSKFEAAFAGLSQYFESYFNQLFGGGKASLVLVPDAAGNYGIEIKAVPPGKRVESLATLSGGERALTGTALLAAILTVNPSPFVVLDEIDAALDEANSSRLSQILADLSKHSQLIVITHNRQVMAAAKSLYGVTMDEHHVSKLLSIRLETATQMAAR